jgi:hypothetical protein
MPDRRSGSSRVLGGPIAAAVVRDEDHEAHRWQVEAREIQIALALSSGMSVSE